MDQFRSAAYLDLLNGKSAAARIASGQLATTDPVDGEPEDAGNDGRPGGGSPSSPRSPGDDRPDHERPPRPLDLVLPLVTLLGVAERPGESHGLGPLDPDLCRQLAIAAIGSPWTRLCVTVTDAEGIAIGHGCAKPARNAKIQRIGLAGLHLPAQVNLTITIERLAELAGAGPPGGSGTWLLTLPSGRELTVILEPMPTYECDHRHESLAYQPNDRLRHLVQVRDYTCTFPTCNRHAKDSDFEHAIPYDKGGRTCGCNAGARSRACHQVKQSKGWKVTQPRPGWHQWETPSGRTYLQPPKHYPT
jgi:hypothetical protein